MHALEWLRKAKDEPERSVYVVHGDDPYLIRESVAAIVRRFFPDGDAAGVERFAGSETALADLLDLLHTLPFFGKWRLAVVEEADPFVTRYRSEIERYVEKPAARGVLVLQTRSWPSNTRLAKAIEASGLSIQAACPRESELPGWLVQLARSVGGAKLDKDAAQLLVELVGPAPGALAAEVEKLAVYAGEERHITAADVSTMVGAGRIESIWKILDAATNGQAAEALTQLDALIASGEPPIALLAAMSTNLLKLHHAGLLRTRKVSLGEACQAAGIPPFAVDKTRRQHAHLGPRRTDQLPRMLLNCDLGIKGGSTLDPRVILENLLAQLAIPRRD